MSDEDRGRGCLLAVSDRGMAFLVPARPRARDQIVSLTPFFAIVIAHLFPPFFAHAHGFIPADRKPLDGHNRTIPSCHTRMLFVVLNSNPR